MDLRIVALAIVFAFVWQTGVELLCAAEAPLPNIVFILADDLGYGDPSCYGGKISTPTLDGVAAQGIRFTDAHTTSSVCSPTRYALMTGRYNWRSKLKKGVLGGLSPRLIEQDRMTIAMLLKSAGYNTGCVGKWHLGMNWAKLPGKELTELNIEPREQVFNVDYGQPISNGPNSVGFDYYFGISASLDMVPYTFIENDRVVALPTDDREFLMMDGRRDGPKTRKGPTAPGFEAADVLPTLVRKSVDFINRHAVQSRNGKPFLLYVPLASPHTPILPQPNFLGRSGMNPYADFVVQTDAAIGEILGALDQQGISRNTLVVITSDNGCSPQAKFDELANKDHHPSGPLRGHKADIFEGGHRVPFLVRWPQRVTTARESGQLISLVDMFATAAEIAGVSIPVHAAEDSFSFLPTLLDSAAPPKRDHLVSHSINGSFAIRKGAWKLSLCTDSGGWSEPRPGSSGARALKSPQLYDLASDLGERNNQFAAHPDKVQELTALLETIVASGRSTPGPAQSNTGLVDIRMGLSPPDAQGK